MINEITKILECNNVPIAMIESIRNTLVRFEKNRRRFVSRYNPDLQRLPNNTTPDAEHDRNRKRLENNDQIVIQIPKGLTVFSIQIEFHQEKTVHRNRRIVDSF